jgi:hypothetical protein
MARFSLGQAINTTINGYVVQGAASTPLWMPDNYWATARQKLLDSGYTITLEQTGGTLYLPATQGTVDGGTMANIGASPSLVRVAGLADAATQGIFWSADIPDDWAAGDLSAQIVWSPGATDGTAHTVRWTLTARVVRNALALFGGPVTTTFTGLSGARTQDMPVFETATNLGLAPIQGDMLRFEVQRIGADGADTYVGTVNVIGVILGYVSMS